MPLTPEQQSAVQSVISAYQAKTQAEADARVEQARAEERAAADQRVEQARKEAADATAASFLDFTKNQLGV